MGTEGGKRQRHRGIEGLLRCGGRSVYECVCVYQFHNTQRERERERERLKER